MDNQNKEHEQHTSHSSSKNWYDKTHKIILIIPLIMLIFTVVYLVHFNSKNGDIIYKDVSLTGGTTVTVFDSNVNIDTLKTNLLKDFPDLNVREISDINTGAQRGFILETKAGADEIRAALEKDLGYKLTSDNSSIEFTGSTVSAGFYQQLINSVIASFLLMACVVFIIFASSKRNKSLVIMLTFLGVGIALETVSVVKGLSIAMIIGGMIYGLWRGEKKKYKNYLIFGTAVITLAILLFVPLTILLLPILALLVFIYITSSIPSFAVILCAFADIAMTVAVVDLLGITLSLAGIIAFLMLIGYSVDTDILMTTRLLKEKEGSINTRMFGAFKTGMMMTLTSVTAVTVSLIVIRGFSNTLHQIFTIILIGLAFDIFNTWITNSSMLKWYMEAKHLT